MEINDRNINKLIGEFFAPEVMEKIMADHHKHRDGTIAFERALEYDYFEDTWHEIYTVRHNGYVRGEIQGSGDTLEEAIANFKANWLKAEEGAR